MLWKKVNAEQDEGGFITCGLQRRPRTGFRRGVRAGFGEKMKSEQKPEGDGEFTSPIPWGRTFQALGTASGKVLREAHAWPLGSATSIPLSGTVGLAFRFSLCQSPTREPTRAYH